MKAGLAETLISSMLMDNVQYHVCRRFVFPCKQFQFFVFRRNNNNNCIPLLPLHAQSIYGSVLRLQHHHLLELPAIWFLMFEMGLGYTMERPAPQ